MARKKSTVTVRSYHLQGMECMPVDIEVDIAQGLPQFLIVGLPDAAVSEARDRVRSAIKNSGFEFPRQRVTVNLAPAYTRKAGSHFDLPIAVGILAASGTIQNIPEQVLIGELALNGSLRAVRGALPLAAQAEQDGQGLIAPAEQAGEIAFLDSDAWFAESITDVAHFCNGQHELLRAEQEDVTLTHAGHRTLEGHLLEEIVGQHMAKRACVIAAAGNHNLLLSGPPGAGKSMLARALRSLMPPLTHLERVESMMVQSVAMERVAEQAGVAPFRAPHHSTSTAAMVGGGSQLLPGEISLAHNGILFLDELPEFRRDVLESLRQPLEEGTITVRRATGKTIYPAQCLLVAALNPCPCGYAGTQTPGKHCTCSQHEIDRYKKKISGPLLDRIDLKVHVQQVDPEEIVKREMAGITTEKARAAIESAREMQLKRQGSTNGQLTNGQLEEHCVVHQDSQQLLNQAMKLHGLSMRGYHKALRVSRTIADLEGQKQITPAHIAEALGFVLPMAEA